MRRTTRGSAASTASRPKVSTTSRATRRAAADWAQSRLRTSNAAFMEVSFVQLDHAALLQQAVREQRLHERLVDVVDHLVAHPVHLAPDLHPGGVLVLVADDGVE